MKRRIMAQFLLLAVFVASLNSNRATAAASAYLEEPHPNLDLSAAPAPARSAEFLLARLKNEESSTEIIPSSNTSTGAIATAKSGTEHIGNGGRREGTVVLVATESIQMEIETATEAGATGTEPTTRTAGLDLTSELTSHTPATRRSTWMTTTTAPDRTTNASDLNRGTENNSGHSTTTVTGRDLTYDSTSQTFTTRIMDNDSDIDSIAETVTSPVTGAGAGDFGNPSETSPSAETTSTRPPTSVSTPSSPTSTSEVPTTTIWSTWANTPEPIRTLSTIPSTASTSTTPAVSETTTVLSTRTTIATTPNPSPSTASTQPSTGITRTTSLPFTFISSTSSAAVSELSTTKVPSGNSIMTISMSTTFNPTSTPSTSSTTVAAIASTTRVPEQGRNANDAATARSGSGPDEDEIASESRVALYIVGSLALVIIITVVSLLVAYRCNKRRQARTAAVAMFGDREAEKGNGHMNSTMSVNTEATEIPA